MATQKRTIVFRIPLKTWQEQNKAREIEELYNQLKRKRVEELERQFAEETNEVLRKKKLEERTAKKVIENIEKQLIVDRTMYDALYLKDMTGKMTKEEGLIMDQVVADMAKLPKIKTELSKMYDLQPKETKK
jgi:hypothetical protein